MVQHANRTKSNTGLDKYTPACQHNRSAVQHWQSACVLVWYVQPSPALHCMRCLLCTCADAWSVCVCAGTIARSPQNEPLYREKQIYKEVDALLQCGVKGQYMHMYVYTHMYICTHTYTYMYIHAHMYAYMCIYMYTLVCVCIYIHM